ncbi:MAG: YesL family protein [Bacillota bacterium]
MKPGDLMTARMLILGSYKLCEKIMLAAYLNVLWILFTAGGFIIFGVIPSTIGLFTVIRKMILYKDKDIRIFSEYWKAVKKEFVKSNAMGFLLTIVTLLLWLNFQLLQNISGIPHLIFLSIICMAGMMWAVLLLYWIPVYIHFELPIRNVLSAAFLIGLSNPLYTILMIIGLSVLYMILLIVPGLFPFFSISISAFLIMQLALKAIERNQKITFRNEEKR